ncbi:MAG: FHA domain-containing protein [Gemmatimonadota bacterium]
MTLTESGARTRYAAGRGRGARDLANRVPPHSQPPSATLLVRTGEQRGRRIFMRSAVTTIGSAGFNDALLPGPGVSAAHAAVHVREGVWILADLGSAEGTWVDGQRVQGDAPLAPGSLVRLGQIELLFNPWDSLAAEAAAPTVLLPPPASEGRSAPVLPPLVVLTEGSEDRRTLRQWGVMALILIAAFAVGFLIMAIR